MKKYITKKNIIILFSVLVILLSFIFYFTQQEKISELPKGNRINSPIKTINMKELCKIDIQGYNSEAAASIFCEIPEFNERKEKIVEQNRVNRENYILNYSDEEKDKTMEILMSISGTDDNYICHLDKEKNLSNGDVINVNCEVENLKYLNYLIQNEKFIYEISGLEERPKEEIDEKPNETQNEQEIVNDGKKETDHRFLQKLKGNGGTVVFPVNPEKYDYTKIEEGDIYIVAENHTFEKAKNIAKKEKRVVGVVLANKIYFADEEFKEGYNFAGFVFE